MRKLIYLALMAVMFITAVPAHAEVDTRSSNYAQQGCCGSYTNIGVQIQNGVAPFNVPSVYPIAWHQAVSGACPNLTMNTTALPANAATIATIQGSGNGVNVTISAAPNGAQILTGEQVVVSSTTHYNGTYIISGVSSGTAFSIYNQTQPPNTTLESSGSIAIGVGVSQVPSSPVSVSDGASGNFCFDALVNPTSLTQFVVPTLASGSADFIKTLGVQDENVSFGSSAVDISGSATGTGTTITCPSVTTTTAGDHVVCFIFQDTPTDNIVVGTPSQPAAPWGLVIPFAQVVGNNAINPVPLAPGAAQTIQANNVFIAMEEWGVPVGATGTIATTTLNNSPWAAITIAFKPLYTDWPENFGSHHAGPVNATTGTFANAVSTGLLNVNPGIKINSSFGKLGQIFSTDGSTGSFWIDHLSYLGGANAVVSNSVANVFPYDGTGAPVATTSEGTVMLPAANGTSGNYSNMVCTLTDATGTVTVAGGTNYIVALRQGGVTTALTCTIATAANHCSDVTHTVGATGAMLDYIITPSGTPTALIPHCVLTVD